jgi:hypothetical protein
MNGNITKVFKHSPASRNVRVSTDDTLMITYTKQAAARTRRAKSIRILLNLRHVTWESAPGAVGAPHRLKPCRVAPVSPPRRKSRSAVLSPAREHCLRGTPSWRSGQAAAPPLLQSRRFAFLT